MPTSSLSWALATATRSRPPGWWLRQIDQFATFYRSAQFGHGPIDFTQYRTYLERDCRKRADHVVHETDTISRMLYGMASAYMITEDKQHLEVAVADSQYLNENFRGPAPKRASSHGSSGSI